MKIRDAIRARSKKPKKRRRVPVMFNPATVEAHGVTIPVPTPRDVNIPNPWKPGPNGDVGADAERLALEMRTAAAPTDEGNLTRPKGGRTVTRADWE